MAISRAQLLKQLLPGLNAIFGESYKEHPAIHTQIYQVLNSDRSFEEDLKTSGFGPAPVKDEGEPIAYDTAQEHYVSRYIHETVGTAFAITEEAMDDNLYESLSARYTRAMARAMAHTKQVKAHALLNNGFTTYNSGDGVTLFNTAHPTVGGGTNANRPSVGTDLNETSLESAIIQLASWTDERGLFIAAKPKRLIVPPQLQFVAERLLKSEYRVGTADNDINALVNMGAIPGGFLVSVWLTDPNAWFMTTDIPDGLKHFVRWPYRTKMDGDFDTGNVRFKAWERYSFGVSDPLAIWGSPGSS